MFSKQTSNCLPGEDSVVVECRSFISQDSAVLVPSAVWEPVGGAASWEELCHRLEEFTYSSAHFQCVVSVRD